MRTMDRSKCLFAVTNCTIEDALWRKIARTITTPSQRQSSWTYSRTDKFDRASSVFEPEPYGALPGIEEVLFNTEITTIEACLKRLEGKQDEEATRNTGEGERQQDWSQRALEDATNDHIVISVSDFNPEPANLDDFQPRHGYIENGEVSSQKCEIAIDNGNSPICGKYPLFDMLSLSTTTGNINVAVMPQPADPVNAGEPARLRIRSQSGNISVSFTTPLTAYLPEMEKQMEVVECADFGNEDHDKDPHTLPLRPYEIEIETDSGTISGRFIVSQFVHLFTKSGNINATLVPIASDLEHVSILTQTTSGSQQIHLTDPSYTHGPQRDVLTLTAARASHISDDGSMQIRYPSDWAGVVRTQPGSGSISLVGQGMKVVREEDGSVEGRKGKDGEGENWWGAWGNMGVSLGSKGAAMFVVG